MTTNYPAGLDAFTNPTAAQRTQSGSAPVSHAGLHADNNDAIEAIEAEVGLLPSGSHATIRARLDVAEDAPFPRLSSFLEAGHSYMDPRGIGCSNAKRGIASRLSAGFGVEPHRVSNISASGAAMRAAQTNGAARYLQDFNPGELGTRPLVPHVGGVASTFGTNDGVLGYSAGATDAFEGGYLATVARWICAAVYDYNSTSLGFTGTWGTTTWTGASDLPLGSGDGMRTSSTVGDVVTHTLEAGWDTSVDGMYVDFTFITAYGDSGCTATIKRDGTTVSTKTIRTGFWPDQNGTDVARVWCPAGTTTVSATVATCTAGAVRFNCVSYEATVPPLVMLLEMILPPNPQWVWAGITQATVDAYNASHDTIVAFFATGSGHSIGSVVKITDLDSTIGDDPEYFSTDGLHPNDRGALTIQGLVLEQVMALLHAGTITRDQLGAWWYGEADPLTVEENRTELITGDPQLLVDSFNRADATTIGGTGWTERSGGWGILAQQAAVYNDRFPYPDFRDQFNRADGAVGNGWTATVGTWVIESEEVSHTATAGGFLTSPNTLVSGDGWLSFTMASTAITGAGIFFRYTDANNHWRAVRNATFGTWYLTKVEAGVETTELNPIYLGGTADGTEMSVNLVGTTMEFYVDGVYRNSHTSSFNENATACGLYSSTAGSVFRWDDFKQGITPISLTPDDPGFNLLTRDLGTTTGVIGVNIGQDTANFAGIVFRYADEDNWLALYQSVSFGAWAFVKCVAGTVTTVTSPISGTLTPGKRVDIEMVTATTFRFYFDGVECSQGLQTVSDAPTGTHAGFRSNYTLTTPLALFDHFLFGEARADVAEGQWARNTVTGKMWGPWESGAPSGSYVFLPTDHSASGLTEAVYDIVAAILTQGSGITITPNDGANTITLSVP